MTAQNVHPTTHKPQTYYIINQVGQMGSSFNWLDPDEQLHKDYKDALKRFKKLDHSRGYFEIQTLLFYADLAEPVIGRTILTSEATND